MTVWGIGHAVLSLLCVGLLFLCAWLLGLSLLRRVGLVCKVADSNIILKCHATYGGLSSFLVSTGIGLGILIILIEVMGLTNLLSPAMLWGVLCLCILVCFREWRPVFCMMTSGLRECAHRAFRMNRIGQIFSALLCIEASTVLLLDLTPVNGWDASVYHLTVPVRFLEAGGFIDLPTIAHSYLPMNIEMLFLWALGLYGEQAAHLVLGVLGLLACLSVYAIAQRMMIGRSALFAMGLFFLVPIVWADSTSLFVDLGMTYFVLLAVLVLSLPKRVGLNMPLFAGAFFFGLAMGSKFLAVLFLPIVGYCALIRIRRLGVPSTNHLILTVFVFLLPYFLWPLRTLILTGNPLYPVGNTLFGLSAAPALHSGITMVIAKSSLLWRAILAPWHQTAGYYSPARIWEGGWGPFVLAFAPLTLFSRPRSCLRLWILPICTSFFLYLMLAPLPRYGLPLLAFGSIYAANGLRWLESRSLDLFRFSMVVILLAGGLFCCLYAAKALQRSPVVIGAQSVEDYLMQRDSMYPVARWVNAHRSPGGAVLLIGERSLRFKAPTHVLMTMSPFFEEVFVRKDPLAFYKHLRRMGVTDIVVSRHYLGSDLATFKPVISAFLEKYADEYHEQDGYAVYRLRVAGSGT